MSDVATHFHTKVLGHTLVGDLNFGFAVDRLKGGASKLGMVTVPELWNNTIGYEIDQEDWNKAEGESDQLKAQSRKIAERLEGQGIPSKIEGQTSTIGVCTGVIEKIISYRNTNIIPVMQSKNVHGISRHVKFYADNTDKKQLRMFTISNGWVPLSDYREEHKKFTRRISKFSAHENLTAVGVELAYYNIENTIKRENGVVMLNMHSHVLYKSTKRFGPKKWLDFIKWATTQFPKGYLHDSRIDNVQECVKYVFKPAEFNALSDIELAELFHQTFGLKFFHPLGEIRAFRRELEDNKMKLVKLPPEDATEADTEQEAPWEWRIIEKAKTGTREPSEDSGEDAENILMAITNPSPKFSNQFEPCLVVHNFDGDIEALIEREGISKLIDKAKEIWAVRTASMRHTTTTTVQQSRKKRRQKPPNNHKEHFNRNIPQTEPQNQPEQRPN